MASFFTNIPANKTRGPEVLAIAWTSTSLAIIMVALRLYTRMTYKNIGWDDYTIVVALALCILGSAMVTLAVESGFGRHLTYIQFREIPSAIKWCILAELSAYFSTYFIKLSVCFFVFRLISGAHGRKGIVRILYALMAFMTIVCIASIITLAVECIPFADIWDLFGSNRHCLPDYVQPLMVKIYGALGAATDIACVACPVYVVRKLQMKRRIKLLIMFLVGLGLFTAACSIAKSVTANLSTPDSTWDLVPPAIWQLLEQNLGIVVACAPPLRQLFHRRKVKSNRSDDLLDKKALGNKEPFFSDPEALGGSSGESTYVSDHTTASNRETLNASGDPEASTLQNSTQASVHSKHDAEPSPTGRTNQPDFCNQINSVQTLIREPEMVHITKPTPAPQIHRDSTNEPPLLIRPLAVQSPGKGRVILNNKHSSGPPQLPSLDFSQDQHLMGELLPFRRLSDEILGEPGVALPSLSDYISPWEEGPRSSLAAPHKLNSYRRAQAAHVGITTSNESDINFNQSQQERRPDSPAKSICRSDLDPTDSPTLATTTTMITTTQRKEENTGFTASSSWSRPSVVVPPPPRSQPKSRPPSSRNVVDRRQDPLPLHSSANQYQQRWM